MQITTELPRFVEVAGLALAFALGGGRAAAADNGDMGFEPDLQAAAGEGYGLNGGINAI